MTQPPFEMERRAAAAQACVDRYADKPFAWGSADCGRLAATTLKAMGHKVSLASFGGYSSEAGARRVLAKAGHADMASLLDTLPLMRIGHARALPGDLIGFQGLDGWVAVAVVLGNGRVLGFVDGFARVLKPLVIETAWRVPCRR